MKGIDFLERNEKMQWNENWSDIPGFPDYQASDHGNIRSFKRGYHPRLLKLTPNNLGYARISISDANGIEKNKYVHSLVMLAFVGKCPDGLEIAHLNGNPADNRLSNLAYVTHSENESHKVIHGRTPTGEKNGNSKLLGWQVAEIKYLASKSIPQGRIAALFDITHKRVSSILTGATWNHIEARQDMLD